MTFNSTMPGMIAVPRPDPASAIERSAQEVEAQFLGQFLLAAGAGRPPDGFGGGIGEDQFASLLVNEHARSIAARGGMGLAEIMVRALQSEGERP